MPVFPKPALRSTLVTERVRHDEHAPWYLEYFDCHFWSQLDKHDAALRSSKEVSYLSRVLREHLSGYRVVDLGCGDGARAVALAEAGFEVLAVEVSDPVASAARARAEEAGIAVQWFNFDPFILHEWPFGEVDALICMHAFGWVSDGLQRRFFHKVRRHLRPNGLLLIEQCPFWLGDSCLGTEKDFDAQWGSDFHYDPSTGRVRGHVHSGNDGSFRLIDYDFRRYTLAELTSLVRSSGFQIKQIDADLSSGSLVTGQSKRVEVLAQSLPAPPEALAVTDWGRQQVAQLDLRYAPDEAEWLDPQPSDVWDQFIRSHDRTSGIVGNYPVYDPFGADRGAAVIGKHFDCALTTHQVTFAAGVTALLRCLADLADGGVIAAHEFVHGDLEAWAITDGAKICLVPEESSGGLRAALSAICPTLLHLDRPMFNGRFLDLDELSDLVDLAAKLGTIVVIDESAAPYPGPLQSAVRLVNGSTNLVVLRGFTKAYSLGGMRAGFSVCSPTLAARVRELVPPLQVGELALAAALELLEAGDVFGALRSRIHNVKPHISKLLASHGFEIVDGYPSLPWIAVNNSDGRAEQILFDCGIRCLRPSSPPAATQTPPKLIRVTIPISDSRIELFRHLLGQCPGKAFQTHRNDSTTCPAAGQGNFNES